MLGIEPRAFLRLLVEEWPLVESLHHACQEGTITQTAVWDRLRSYPAERSAAEAQALLERLQKNEIVVAVPGTEHRLELGEFVQVLIEHLLREQRLGLAEGVLAYLNEIQRLGNQLARAVDAYDDASLVRFGRALEQQIRDIIRQVNTNGEAIAELATRAKTDHAARSVRARYAEVLEAWDHYVEPLRQMVDINQPFEQRLEKLEQQLRDHQRKLITGGSLISRRELLERIEFRLLQMRSLLKRHFAEARELLLPLVQEVRRNSAIARGASLALDILRKRGMRELPSPPSISRRSRTGSISSNHAIEQFVANLTGFRPRIVKLSERSEDQIPALPPLNSEAVLSDVKTAVPIADLMAWLILRYPDAPSDELLDVHDYVLAVQARSIHRGERRRYETAAHYLYTARREVLT
ncbi:MAG: hypothetical protein ACREVE_05405 [Gammaproteobacteria bacterium]